MQWNRVRKSVVDVIIATFTGFAKSNDQMLIGSRRLAEHENKQDRYRAYLLRCWQERQIGPDQGPLWRFAVEDVFGERLERGFGSLEALLAFLRVELTGSDYE